MNKRVVLVVDDDPPIRDMLEDILEQEGYTVLCAVDGSEGYLAAVSSLPDLILADLMMPGLDGRVLARRLAEDPRAKHIPIVLMSAAYASQPDDHFAAVLAKPFTFPALLDTLRTVLP